MSLLFRSLNSGFFNKRESAIKEVLINTLQENVREIQYEIQQSGCSSLELCESTSSLCTTLEALFLHGLKDSFLWQTINVIAGDIEHRPDPSFWSPLLVFLHKQVIEQVQSLSQITSEVGQCRVWIRLSLNESLLSSYLNNIRKNGNALSPYYKRHALLKDGEGLEMAAKILEGLEAQSQFNLPVNSSLLNQWPDYSLQLAGIWTPPLKSCPITCGVDVAGSIANDTMPTPIPTPQPLPTNELFSESISNSPFSRSLNFGVADLNQRENLELFLQKVDAMDIIDEEDDTEVSGEEGQTSVERNKSNNRKKIRKNSQRNSTSKDNVEQGVTDDNVHRDTAELKFSNAQSVHGNSLTNLMQNSWSSDIGTDIALQRSQSQPSGVITFSEEDAAATGLQRSVSITSSASSLRSPTGYRCSYNSLLRKHERTREVDWTEVWEKFLLQNNTMGIGMNTAENASEQTQDNMDRVSMSSCNNSEFEVVPFSALEKFDIAELQEMVEQLCKLAREPGLDAQGFLCKSCQHPLGIGYTNFQVCAFSGNYFCDNCMNPEQVLVPAKLIFNWDFRKYPVSKRAAIFLNEFRSQPFIDLKVLNPMIYQFYEPMAELQSLRIRLNFIRAYLYTCCPSSIEELQSHFSGKEYLYEHIHQYSIADLGMIQRGTLNQQLQKAYKAGEAHVLKCNLCSVKGFICEICNSPRVLYPFHIDTTYRCEVCGAVYHANCLNEQQPCPKCERKKRREELPLLEAIQSLV